jgi:hypothetical protein
LTGLYRLALDDLLDGERQGIPQTLAVMWAMWLAVGGSFVAIAVSIYLGNALRQGLPGFIRAAADCAIGSGAG